jgi:hypothetical protein
MRKATVFATVTSGFFLASPAHAEADANFFLQKIRDGDKATLYVLDGYSNAYSWTNVILEKREERPLYCPPEKLAITAEQNADILRRYVERNSFAGTMPAGFALLLALADTFPCAKPSP